MTKEHQDCEFCNSKDGVVISEKQKRKFPKIPEIHLPKRKEKEPESWQTQKLVLAQKLVDQNAEIIMLLTENNRLLGGNDMAKKKHKKK